MLAESRIPEYRRLGRAVIVQTDLMPAPDAVDVAVLRCHRVDVLAGYSRVIANDGITLVVAHRIPESLSREVPVPNCYPSRG